MRTPTMRGCPTADTGGNARRFLASGGIGTAVTVVRLTQAETEKARMNATTAMKSHNSHTINEICTGPLEAGAPPFSCPFLPPASYTAPIGVNITMPQTTDTRSL